MQAQLKNSFQLAQFSLGARTLGMAALVILVLVFHNAQPIESSGTGQDALSASMKSLFQNSLANDIASIKEHRMAQLLKFYKEKPVVQACGRDNFRRSKSVVCTFHEAMSDMFEPEEREMFLAGLERAEQDSEERPTQNSNNAIGVVIERTIKAEKKLRRTCCRRECTLSEVIPFC